MDEKNKVSLAVVIIHCFCAVVWLLTVAVEFVCGYTNIVTFVLHIVCAIVWTICATIGLVRYIKQNKK